MDRKDFIKLAALTGGYLAASGVTKGEVSSAANNSDRNYCG